MPGSIQGVPSPVSRLLDSIPMFHSLRMPNYRRWAGGALVSNIGTWMQRTAQAWLVLTLSGSAAVLGVVVALQALPVLLLGPYAGVVADRVDRRKLMIVLQSVMGLLAAVLAVLALGGWVQVWQVAVLAVLLGLNNAFENPARQAFIHQIVGNDLIRNAVTLNSVLVNAARAIGPAAAGVILAAVGAGWCFAINAASFVAVVFSLWMMRTDEIAYEEPVARAKGQLREGLRYLGGRPTLWVPLVMMAIVALFFVGWLSVSFMSTGNATLQLESEPQMRGRVMALWSVAFMGSTPIGGPIIGAISEYAGARVALGVGAAACFVAAAMAYTVFRIRTRQPARIRHM